jgi:hypothetical protein
MFPQPAGPSPLLKNYGFFGGYEKLQELTEKQPFFMLIYEPKAHSTLC